MDEKVETRVVKDNWDLTNYTWRVETDGLKLLVDGFKDKKVFGRRCHLCNTVYLPGQRFCRKCFIEIEEVVEIKDFGELVTYTATLTDVRGNPFDEPRLAGVFKLEGCDAWLMGTIEGIDWKELKVGMKLKIVWKEEPTGAIADLMHFTPA